MYLFLFPLLVCLCLFVEKMGGKGEKGSRDLVLGSSGEKCVCVGEKTLAPNQTAG